MAAKNILLIDDHSLFRSGLRILISNGIDEVEILESASLEEAMRLEVVKMNLILLDIKLQGLNGLEGTILLKNKWPETVIIVVSADNSPETIKLAKEKGANYFLSKGDSADEILRIISQGLTSNVNGLYFDTDKANTLAKTKKPQFTPRQYEVLDLVCKGLSNKMIARQLQLSENTVRCHVQVLLATLNASNRSEAAFTARRMGLVA